MRCPASKGSGLGGATSQTSRHEHARHASEHRHRRKKEETERARRHTHTGRFAHAPTPLAYPSHAAVCGTAQRRSAALTGRQQPH